MAVYVDAAIWPWRDTLWCHLLADDLDELHRFARQLGLGYASFQRPPKASSPHYDLTIGKRAHAVTLGAEEIDRRTTVLKARQLRAQWQALKTPSAIPPIARPQVIVTGRSETLAPLATMNEPVDPARSLFPHPRRHRR